ncbi:MAG TPA: adenylate/guanylate cyclase domain-containing protein [Actinomycetota bacterium]|nr:adenylate/guanylate cyclase domain-containing protein [Actinomycetota bacterium]
MPAPPTPGPLHAYVPRLALEWLKERPDVKRRKLDASVLMIDVSGFTALSERLARRGKVGAEELTEVISDTFSELLDRAYRVGGGLLKFGGDALLLSFDGPGHASRACHAAASMRTALREVGRVRTSGGEVRLRMSAGVHSGPLHLFLVGRMHRELIVTGPTITRTLQMEAAAGPGQILVSPETAAMLDGRCLGAAVEPGVLLVRAPGEADAAPTPMPPADVDAAPLIPTALREILRAGSDDAEHRQVTMGFLRFSGLDAALAAGRAATVQDRLERLVDTVQEAASQQDVCILGTDVLHDGGKILLTAGAPRTTPDDDERMLLTLRTILDRTRNLALTAGVDRGYVFAGSVGPTYRRTYTVMGDTVNTAARIMGRGAPGCLLASTRVLERSSTVFETKELEPFYVKGKTEPQHAAWVGPPVGVRSRVQADLPIIGRELEMQALAEAWAGALAGHGSVVQVVGEPGVGKSKIVEELVALVGGEALEATAHPRVGLEPYHALAQLLAAALGERPTRSTLVRAIRRLDPALEGRAPLIAAVLGLDLPDTEETRHVEPAFRRPLIEQAVLRLLEAARPGPTLWVVEGADWLDAASADALRSISKEVGRLPWLMVMTLRDEATQPVGDATTVRLDPLPSEDAAALAVAASGGALLPESAARLADRSAGNPLFLLELVSRPAGDVPPSSVESIVAERIDELPPTDRTLLRRLSVLGREFEEALVDELADGEEGTEAVRRLHDFVEHTDGTIRFKRPLYQEVAYEGLPFKVRVRTHQRIGLVLEGRADPALLSFHFHNARDHERAWTYALTAARQARERSAFSTAVELYRRALGSVSALDLEIDDVVQAWFELGESLQWTGRLAEAGEAYRTARRLTDDPGRSALLYQRQGAVLARLGELRRALSLYSRGLKLLDTAGSRDGRWRLPMAYASVLRERGRLKEAEERALEGLRDAEATGDRPGMGHAYTMLQMITADRGDEGADDLGRKALAIFESEGLPAFAALVLNNLGTSAHSRGRLSEAAELFERASRSSHSAGNVLAAAVARGNAAAILADQGHHARAREIFTSILPTMRGAGFSYGIQWAMRSLAQCEARSGRFDEADRWFEQVLPMSDGSPAGATAQAFAAERYALEGRWDEAGEHAQAALGAAGASVKAIAYRVLGYAWLGRGDHREARRALEESRDAADESGSLYEAALTQLALADLSEAEGLPSAELREAAGSILDRLGVVAVPRVPVPAGPAAVAAGPPRVTP